MLEIISACDNNYIQHLGVMLCSLLENTSKKDEINISVIDGGISVENKHKLSDWVKCAYQINVKYLEIDPKIYSEFKIGYHFTHTIYYRISIPSLLPSNINKALYLDCDLIIKDDIEKLWSIELGGYSLAAIEVVNAENSHLEGIMSSDTAYFNSGVLLMNLSHWRENHVSQKIIQFIQNFQAQIIWGDQDSMNAVLYQHWLSLPLKWNLQTSFFDINANKCKRKMELIEAIAKPAIIHYTGMHKPWDYISNHPYKQEYYKYLALTPWHGYKPKKNAKLIVMRLIRLYVPRFFLVFMKQLVQK
jgi:lipopolysaccharide biosynthesis glycosyltransferase